ncbi:unnamed protein product [Zymoseptoria tritici ST99CH_1E4]|uniref:Plus3 domain-containing protein n=1 Tax=Zymoseptoria tritici ST99CH_1E4 TaxID=1276532 RepID=A0A2H1FKI0_ZYMTR|nr:unnamed protein product [Zymoseptoria tritici ST99CH_1E4]
MSAEDLDNELLGLVNDDSSDSEVDDLDRLDQTQVIDDRSPTPEPKQSVEKNEENGAGRKGVAQRGVAQKVKSRGRRRPKQQESEDEGEASSSPARSVASDRRRDSDNDAAADFDDETPLYPIEGKFMSTSDRERILALPEIEREEILAERAQEVTHRQQDLMLKKAMNENAAQSKQKRKADAAELDDGEKRSLRPKSNKRSALDDYKRAREQKGAERDRRDTGRDRRDQRSPTPISDRDADGESEVEWAEPTSNRNRGREEPPAELRDFERCRVGRSAFAKVCFYPGFEEAIRGCYARISIGLNRETGQNMYRMTQIKGFTEGKPYQLDNAIGKKFTTDQYAIVAQGSAEKPWPFHACSDGRFTQAEYDRFIDTLRKENIRPSSLKLLTMKRNAIDDLVNTQFTEATLQLKFARQKAMEQKHDPAYVAQQKRKDINRRRTEAEEAGDEEEIARCDAELEALNSVATNGPSKVKPPPPADKEMSRYDRFAALNKTNRAKNQQEVRKALIEERNKIAREAEAARNRQMMEVKARVEAKAKDFRVRQDKFDALERGESPAVVSVPASPKKKAAAAVKGPIGALKKRNMDDDIIGELDLGIDLEI